jgi:O-antigen ligase
MSSRERRWLALCPAAAWAITLATGGAKTKWALAIIEALILGGFSVWLARGGEILTEPWQTPLAAFCLWLPANLLAPGSALNGLSNILWIFSVAAFFFLARYLWNERTKELFLSSITGAGIVNAGLVLIQSHAGSGLMGLFSGNPNYSAALTVAASLVSLARIRKQPLSHAVALLLYLASLTRQQSRGAWLALIVVTVSMAGRRWQGRGIAGSAIFLALWIFCMPGNYAFQLSKLGGGPDALARPLIWQSSLRMIREHPFTGWGAGNFEQGFRLYPVLSRDDLFRYEKSTAFAHSLFLQIATDLGIPGLIFFLWAVWRFCRSANPETESGPLLAACLLLAAFDIIFALPALALLFSGIAGVTPRRAAPRSPSKALPPRFRATLCVLAAGAGGFLLVPMTRAESSGPWFWQDRGYFLGWHDHAWGQALLAYQKAEDLNPFHAPLYCQVGELALAHNDPPRAEEEFKRCLALEPNALRAWRGLAAALNREGRHLEAEHLETSLPILTRRIEKRIKNAHHSLSNYALYLLG